MSKDAIKKAALELFHRYSYVKTSVSDIAAKSGIGKGSVYLAFKSKEEILFSLIDDDFLAMKSEFQPWFRDLNVTLEAKIDRFTRITVDQHFQIRDLMFGSFENVEGRELQDVYNKFAAYIAQGSEMVVQVAALHGWPATPERLAAAREFLLTLSGRVLIHILSHDWNSRDEIHQLMPVWAKPVFRAFVLKEFS